MAKLHLVRRSRWVRAVRLLGTIYHFYRLGFLPFGHACRLGWDTLWL